MSKLNFFLLIFFVGFVYFFQSCQTDPEIKPLITDESLKIKWPGYFPEPKYNFEGNKITVNGFALGRKLFYDPILSRDNTIACASCHQQFVAFAHADHRVSHGIDNLLGVRNSPGLFNLIFHSSFFWDGGAIHIENQPIGPIKNPVEMDESLDNVVKKLSNHPEYPLLFKKAFNADSIQTQHIMKALVQFMGSFISAGSKYDLYLNDTQSGLLTGQELRGHDLVKSKCEPCHSTELFSDFSFRNNGLDQVFTDSGRARITKDLSDMGKFKVPSLRNVELTYPYMHDGRFETLEQVLDHYSSGVVFSSTLDTVLTNGISLTEDEKKDIIAFLKTLTDRSFIKDARFSEVK